MTRLAFQAQAVFFCDGGGLITNLTIERSNHFLENVTFEPLAQVQAYPSVC
jgi:hypothetical protein